MDETLEDLLEVIEAIRDNLTTLGLDSRDFERAVTVLLTSLEELLPVEEDEKSGSPYQHHGSMEEE